MKKQATRFLLICGLCAWTVPMAQTQTKPASLSTVQVHVVITDMALRSDAELPRLRQDDVKVKQGKTFLQVTQLIPAQGDNAALQLMVLIDDTLDTSSVGNNLTDLRDFIKAQSPSAPRRKTQAEPARAELRARLPQHAQHQHRRDIG